MNHPTLPIDRAGFVYWRKMERLCVSFTVSNHWIASLSSIQEYLRSRTPCRAIRRSFMWCDARPLCWYDERTNRRIIARLYNLPNTLWSVATVTLPMGWTIQSPFFMTTSTYILQPESHISPSPVHRWRTSQRTKVALHPGRRFIWNNSTESREFRRFVWEHFINLNRIVQHMKYCGGTFSGKKTMAPVVPKFCWVIGHYCTYEGRVADASRIAAIKNWGPCHSLSEVRALLRHYWVLRIFIRNFAHRAHELVKLTRKGAPFEFGRIAGCSTRGFEGCTIHSPALQAIDYTSDSPVIPRCRHISHCSRILPMSMWPYKSKNSSIIIDSVQSLSTIGRRDFPTKVGDLLSIQSFAKFATLIF